MQNGSGNKVGHAIFHSSSDRSVFVEREYQRKVLSLSLPLPAILKRKDEKGSHERFSNANEAVVNINGNSRERERESF